MNKTKFLKRTYLIPILIFGTFLFSSCLDFLFKPHANYPLAKDILTKNEKEALHFFVLSDWGFNGDFGQKNVAKQMQEISKLVGLNFILTCGDNFQYNGVTSATDELWKTNYEDIYNESALQVPWYPALGNHDYYGNPDAEIEYSAIHPNWNFPSRYYSFSRILNARDKALFIVLDTQGLINDYHNLTDSTQTDSIAQIKWIKNALSSTKAKWIFITGHHPVYSASNIHGDTYEMKKLIKPILDHYRVDFYICGHDHHFEHAKDSVLPTNYIVTGTGAYPRSVSSNSRSIFTLSELGFSYFSIYQNSLTLSFVTTDGKIAYSYILNK